jgi:predicted ABC-type ATPase
MIALLLEKVGVQEVINRPAIFVIGGPNGAGKTTAAMSLMPKDIECSEYVNADSIALALSPFNSEMVSIEAGRLMLRRIHELAMKKVTFAFETTMASRTFLPFLDQCKKSGYNLQLIYIWLISPDLSVARVTQRVEGGGHDVPEHTIRRRYKRGMKNFLSLYMPIADGWAVYDNSQLLPRLIAEETKIDGRRIIHSNIWETFEEVANADY